MLSSKLVSKFVAGRRRRKLPFFHIITSSVIEVGINQVLGELSVSTDATAILVVQDGSQV